MNGHGSDKTRRGLTVFSENPFLEDIAFKTRKVSNQRGDMLLVSKDDGEMITPVAGFWEMKEVDTDQFIKIYVKGIADFASLSGPGRKLFAVLCRVMAGTPNSDRLYMTHLTSSKMNLPDDEQMSLASFNRGVRELIDKRFIAPEDRVGWYWVNIGYFYNGDRLALVRVYQKKALDKVAAMLERSG